MVNVTVKSKRIHNTGKGVVVGSVSGLREVVIAIESQSKALSPVDTGFLRASITNRIVKLTGYIYSRISYAIHQEKTANRGQGYLSPAAKIVVRRIIPLMGKNIRSGIRRN